jgi:hypothetical protein
MTERYGRLLNWAVLVAAVIGIIYPAFFDERLSLTQILISLIDFQSVTLGFMMRWLSVIVLCGAAYILITNWLYRNLPISVIWTRVDVYFDSPDGSRVRVDREQALRANQPGVTAYFLSCKPNAENGRVSERDITGSVHCGDVAFQDHIDLHGTETRGYEIMHTFGTALPYAWYMPLTPVWVLNRQPERLLKCFKRKVPIRRMSITYTNEFNVPKATMSFIAAIYPQHNVSIYFHFPQGNAVRNLQAKRIKSNGVVDVRPRDQGNSNFLLYLDRLENETLRITWTAEV